MGQGSGLPVTLEHISMIKFASPVAIYLASTLTLLKSWPGIWLPSAINNPAELHHSHTALWALTQYNPGVAPALGVLSWATETAEFCSPLPIFSEESLFPLAKCRHSCSVAFIPNSGSPEVPQKGQSLQVSEIHGSVEEHSLTAPRSLHSGSSTGKVHFNSFSKAALFQLNKGKQGAARHWFSLTEQRTHLFNLVLNWAQLIQTPGKGRVTPSHWAPLLAALWHKCNKASQWMHKIHKMIHGSSFTTYHCHLWKK